MSNTSHLDRSTGALARALAAAHGPLGEGARLHTLDHLALVRGGAAVDAGAAPQLVSAQLRGRLVELSAQGASATLTAAVGLVVQCQRDGEPAAWITRAGRAALATWRSSLPRRTPTVSSKNRPRRLWCARPNTRRSPTTSTAWR